MAILTFLLIVGLAYAAYKTCPKNEDGSIKKENVIALIVVPVSYTHLTLPTTERV